MEICLSPSAVGVDGTGWVVPGCRESCWLSSCRPSSIYTVVVPFVFTQIITVKPVFTEADSSQTRRVEARNRRGLKLTGVPGALVYPLEVDFSYGS